MVAPVIGLPGINGTNGAIPTAGKAGGAATYNANGVINADSLTIAATGGNGGTGGNNTGTGAGAKGGDGGAATISINGNIYKPLGSNLEVIATATGGNGGLGGTGSTAGAQGNGGNASVTMNGNIVTTSLAMTDILFDAVALAGTGTRYGNASATVNGNIVTYNNTATPTAVILVAAAAANGTDAVTNTGNNNFGTKTATVSGNIVNGNVAVLAIYADAYLSNGTATISGNIYNPKLATPGTAALEAMGQKIAISGNIFNLGGQNLAITLDELGPVYNASVSGNIFTGNGTNTLTLTDIFYSGAPTTPNSAAIDLGAGTFVFDGQSNQLKNFANVVLSPDIIVSLTGSNADNMLNGGAGNDLLKGLGGNDTLNGNGGNDILWGGTGNDLIDGGAGLDVAYFAGRETQYTLSGTPLPAGPFTVAGGPDGTDTLSNVERVKFLSPTHVSDVDNNGFGDLIFQNSGTGAISVSTNPGGINNTLTFAPAPGVNVIGTGQFNSDVNRRSDILLQDSATGNLSVLLDITGVVSLGPQALTGAAITPLTLNPNWKAVTSGDFNGDAASDVLLQNVSTGAVEIMLLNSTNYLDPVGTVDSITSVTTPGANWKAISSGDFDGDGKSDILWQNTVTGQTEVYLMNGAAIASTGSALSAPVGAVAIGTGDFNGDDKSDIIFKTGTGDAQIWLMNGTSQTGAPVNVLNPGGPSYSLKGAEDINNDGYSDLLWEDNANGNVIATEMTTGGAVLLNVPFASPGLGFKLIASTGGG